MLPDCLFVLRYKSHDFTKATTTAKERQFSLTVRRSVKIQYFSLVILSSMSYIPPPKALTAFPDAVIVKGKTLIQGSNQKRRRWQTPDNKFYEWDYRHGTVEKYDKNGRHLGEFDHVTGNQTKKADPNRRIEI